MRIALRKAERRSQFAAALLVAPLVIFLVFAFLVPLGLMLSKGGKDTEFGSAFPDTVTRLRSWDGRALPPSETVATFLRELAGQRGSQSLSFVANRLNFDINGMRSALMKVARRPPASDVPDPMGSLIALDPRWGEIETWGTMKRAIGPWTDFYLLAAVDLKRDATGAIAKVPEERAVFTTVFVRTFWISLIVAFFCAALGYPVAYLLATQPPAVTNLLLILVLLPFWTSVMVRTAAWVVLLQSEGLVNQVLAWVGFINEPLKLIYNRIGVVIAMVHVLLPFMVLPLYSVMKGISGNTMRAAVSLGAHPFVAFARVYFPQTLPGVMAGTLLVFISSIGYYITPAIVGGADDQMISFFIAFYTNQTLNWGLAAALGTALLGATLLLYFVYARLAGGAKPQLG